MEREYAFEVLLGEIMNSGKNYDVNKIMEAYRFAEKAHGEQKRASGEPYIIHPVAVASILFESFLDTDTIVAALLHDVVEDSETTLVDIQKKFGDDVANLVNGVTKIGKITLDATAEERQLENVRKILLATDKDIRVMLIKLADRLHNMRTLQYVKEEKQRRVSTETMSIYAPIAHKLGMARVKVEMEDIAIKYLDPFGYAEVVENLEKYKEHRDNFIDKIIYSISERFDDMTPPPTIEGRVKGIFGIYKKFIMEGKPFESIYDVFAIRIIMPSDNECYSALGVIHDMFSPIDGRFKDYIGTSKSNGYQSLHTTVIGKDGVPFEVQIRTARMHDIAQYGVAAHWRYKLGVVATRDSMKKEERFDFIRKAVEQQQETDDVDHLAEIIRSDLSEAEVHVFTPKGEPKSLPKGATVMDFAYFIHTNVGHKMTGAMVGGKMVKYDYVMSNGEIINILTSNSSSYGPNVSWLDYVNTNDAKAKIRNWLKREKFDESHKTGLDFFKNELKRLKMDFDEAEMLNVAQKHRFKSADEMYAAVGYGGVSQSKASYWLKQYFTPPEENVAPMKAKDNRSSGILVDGVEGCEVALAKCCNPLPGDEIIGFIKRGSSTAIHRKDCKNISARYNSAENNGRMVNVSWTSDFDGDLYASVEVVATDRTGLLLDVSAVIAKERIWIENSASRGLPNGNALVTVTVKINSKEQLDELMAKLTKIQGVIGVDKTGK